ncbi:hypothetical protein ACFLUX_00955 [Chloroflexota bacterium]
MKEYLGEDDNIRNKFLFSKRWMRGGWKEVEKMAKTWVLSGREAMWMTKKGWSLVNKIMLAWAEKQEVTFVGKTVNGRRTGYLYIKLGKICEVVGGAFEHCKYEYYDF